MLVFGDGYICITYADGILQWRECIPRIFRMGGLLVFQTIIFINPGSLSTLLDPLFLLTFPFKHLVV